MNNLNGKWALVTGASAGLGEQFAIQLAQMGASLVLVARRADRLQKLATTLQDQYKVETRVLALDLLKAGAGENLFAATEQKGIPVSILINNAGFGVHKPLLDQTVQQTAEQIQVNITVLTELTHRFGMAMSTRHEGYILNVASVAAYMPIPGYAIYAATKAYVLSFSDAIAHEFADQGVQVSCLCPGPTATEFMDVAGHQLQSWQKKFLMSSEECVRIGLDGLFAGSRSTVTGLFNKVVTQSLRMLPRSAIVASSAKIMA